MDDVLLNKVAIIERCLARIAEEYRGFEAEFRTNYTKQDSVILNLQRACEACIDIGHHLVRRLKLAVPQDARSVFSLLAEHNVLDTDVAHTMGQMVGFRNIAIHEYQSLNLDVVVAIVEQHLDDFRAFARAVLVTSFSD